MWKLHHENKTDEFCYLIILSQMNVLEVSLCTWLVQFQLQNKLAQFIY